MLLADDSHSLTSPCQDPMRPPFSKQRREGLALRRGKEETRRSGETVWLSIMDLLYPRVLYSILYAFSAGLFMGRAPLGAFYAGTEKVLWAILQPELWVKMGDGGITGRMQHATWAVTQIAKIKKRLFWSYTSFRWRTVEHLLSDVTSWRRSEALTVTKKKSFFFSQREK